MISEIEYNSEIHGAKKLVNTYRLQGDWSKSNCVPLWDALVKQSIIIVLVFFFVINLFCLRMED